MVGILREKPTLVDDAGPPSLKDFDAIVSDKELLMAVILGGGTKSAPV